MSAPSRGRRIATLLTFFGLVVFALFVEREVLVPAVAKRLPADEVAYWEGHVERNSEYAESRIRPVTFPARR